MKNIIDAIVTIVKGNHLNLTFSGGSNNRANSQGDALENYVKNLFADTFDCSETERLETWSKVFSWLGNKTNPPDFILRNGDAGEVKKIESPDAALALNSSYPKRTLKSSSPLISEACRTAEDWTEKDMLYIVGVVNGNKLKHLCMIYGADYCASDTCYDKIRQLIKTGVETIPFVEFAPTRELGRVNHVDPLGITYLRVRGMWHIENPWRVFQYVYGRNFQANFNFMCLINLEKWTRLENRADLLELQRNYSTFKISDVKIKNPDNPCVLHEAKLIRYEI
ncbi:MAG: NgoPII family restriction endonuclease [Selenomonadaceae bacterium]|nr:NgoPII family restriction endonuclease [Selenomonadaceae bacterium]